MGRQQGKGLNIMANLWKDPEYDLACNLLKSDDRTVNFERPLMKVFFYAPPTEATGQRLLTIVRTMASDDVLEVYNNMGDLIQGLRRPLADPPIGVFLFEDQKDIEALLDVKPLASKVRSILIVPDREPETVALAHQLRPRFLAYADSDLSQVLAVLQKMLGQQLRTKARMNVGFY
jgi:hypothetical protein